MTEQFKNGRAAFHKCQLCGEELHEYFFPWVDQKGATAYARGSEDSPTYAKRERAAQDTRKKAKAKGRNFEKCILCLE